MKSIAIAAPFVFALFLAPAAAQTTAPAPASQGSATPAKQTARQPARQTAKNLRARCRDEVRSQNLGAAERKAAAWTYFAKARPDIAAAVACRHQGRGKGLKGDQLLAFVRDCKTNKAVIAQPPA